MTEPIIVNLGKEYELRIGINAQRRAERMLGKTIGEAMRSMPDINAVVVLLTVGIKELADNPKMNAEKVGDMLESAMESGQTDLATILDALNKAVGATWGGESEKKTKAP